MEIGLIGAGSIGQTLSNAIINKKIPEARLKVVVDKYFERAKKLADENNCHAATNINELTKLPLDLVIEAASQSVVHEYSSVILGNGLNLLVVSVGALVDNNLYQELKDLAAKNNCKIYIPSGAIGGIDIIKSAKSGGLDSVKLTTRKPPKSLGFDPADFEQGDGAEIKLFEGSAREAVKEYPQNINVAAILSIAGLGPDKTKVKVICDPKIKLNVHEIEVEGKFGSSFLKVSNLPSPENSKTSHLACLSTISAINGLSDNIIVGS